MFILHGHNHARLNVSKTMNASINPPTGLGWALWVCLAATPWLLPLHSEVWAAFHAEALAAATIVPIGLWVGLRYRQGWHVDATALGLLLLAVVPLGQALFGLFVLPGEAFLVAGYLAACAFTVIVARRAEEATTGQWIDASMAALAIAALLSTGIALYQWLGLDGLGILVHYRALHGQSLANVGQPNNLATLLCWGVIAIWWGHSRKKLGAAVALMAVAFLLVGVALTRSRTGWLEVLMLGGAALYMRRCRQSGPPAAATLLLLGWFGLWVVGSPAWAQHMRGEAPEALRAAASIGLRPAIWRIALDEVLRSPVVGHGWNQSVPAYLQVFEAHPEIRLVVSHAHNLVLDLLVWSGVPLGLVIVGALALWARIQWRACQSQAQRLLLLALALLLLHAMLELPHTYLYFLLPAAVMVGTLEAMRPSAPIVTLSRVVGAGVAAALGLVVVLAVQDYNAIERDVRAARMRDAGIHHPDPPPAAQPRVLGFLHGAITLMNTEPSRELPPSRLTEMRLVLDRYPTYRALSRYARVAAMAGHPIEARWALSRLCALNSAPRCDAVLREWVELAEQGRPEMKLVALPSPR